MSSTTEDQSVHVDSGADSQPEIVDQGDVKVSPADPVPDDQQPPAEPPSGATSSNRISLSAAAEYGSYLAKTTQLCWAVANFKAPFYEPTSRAPVDIVAVIDKSGSMRGAKIELVKKTLLFVVDQLKECDRLSLVTYDCNVELVFGLMKMNQHNKERAKSFVESIRDGSSTNLCGGLLKGMEQVALTSEGEKAQVQSVLLLTDGLANNWITTKDGIIKEMKKMQEKGLGAVAACPSSSSHDFWGQQMQRQQPAQPLEQRQSSGFFSGLTSLFRRGNSPEQQQQQQQAASPEAEAEAVETETKPKKLDSAKNNKFDGTVYTFGFGSDHDASMLEAISTQGGGVYYYIDSNEKIPESFADCLGGLLSVMGQNLSLKLEVVGGNTFKDVHANRTTKWITQKKCCEIAMGDLQSEEERDIVVEVNMPALPEANPDYPVFKAQLSYFNIITSLMDTVECQLTVNRALTDEGRGPGSMTVDVQRNRILTTTVLKEAETLADRGNLPEAQKTLKSAIAKVEASLSKDHDLSKGLVTDMKKCLENMRTRDAYRAEGKLMVTSRLQSHAVQRSNYISEDITSYQSSSKVMFKSRAKNVK